LLAQAPQDEEKKLLVTQFAHPIWTNPKTKTPPPEGDGVLFDRDM
jgi:hypothetical protein